MVVIIVKCHINERIKGSVWLGYSEKNTFPDVWDVAGTGDLLIV